MTPEESPKKDRSSSPGLSDLSDSEYEHARKHPITKKDVLWQEGMVRNTMLYHTQGHASRTNTWGTVPEASDVSLSEQHRATSSARGRVSNNLQDDQDPVLIATGKVKSLQPIRRDILKSADSLRLRTGQELMVFHRINYLDQNAVVRNASVYTDGIVEDAYERGTDRSVAAKARQAQAIKAPLQLLRRNSPNIPMSVSGTALVTRECAVTGGSSTMMLMRTPDGKIADLRKQKEAVMYLSGTHDDEDDMSYYAALFKRTMEADIATAASTFQQQRGQNVVTEQEKEEARQASSMACEQA